MKWTWGGLVKAKANLQATGRLQPNPRVERIHGDLGWVGADVSPDGFSWRRVAASSG